ncbi:Nn.00g107720.m01.CDS01 [Neocucurbitaria sp. VM-36]
MASSPMLVEETRDAGTVSPPTSLLRLPNELLLEIASHLAGAGLYNLALTSQRLKPIAQGELHQSIRINEYDDMSSSRIAMLARTLVHRPDLARQVIHLDLDLIRGKVRVDWIIGMFLAAESTSPARVLERMTVRLENTRIAGFILTHLENVKTLSLAPPGQGENNVGCIRELFGEGFQADLAVRDLTRVTGLAKLQQFHLRCHALEWEWCKLPCLKELRLGKDCFIGDYSTHTGSSKIETLTLDCFLDVFMWGRTPYRRHLPAFLGCLPMLTKLCIHLLNAWHEFDDIDFSTGSSFAGLINALNPIAPTLEYLCIADPENDWHNFQEYILPVSTLVQFKCLKYLEIPQVFLFRDPPNGTSLRQFLAPSIVDLTLHWTSAGAIEWLETIPGDKSYFTNLKHISLVPRPFGRPGYEKFRTFSMIPQDPYGDGYGNYKYINHGIWRQLEVLGIHVTVRYYPNENRLDEEAEEDDPFVCELVALQKVVTLNME